MKAKRQIFYLLSQTYLEANERPSLKETDMILSVINKKEGTVLSDGFNTINLDSTVFDLTEKDRDHNELLKNSLYLFKNCEIIIKKVDFKKTTIKLSFTDFETIMPIFSRIDENSLKDIYEDLNETQLNQLNRRVVLLANISPSE